MGVGGQHHAPAALLPGKTRYPLYRRLGRPQGPVWTGAENLAPTGIRFPDRSARSESLYRLSYRGRRLILGPYGNFISLQYTRLISTNCCWVICVLHFFLRQMLLKPVNLECTLSMSTFEVTVHTIYSNNCSIINLLATDFFFKF